MRKRSKLLILLALFMGITLVASACSSDDDDDDEDDTTTTEETTTTEAAAEDGTVVDVITSDPDLSTLATVATAAGVVETLAGIEEVTVFAPTNEAFTAALETLAGLGLTQDQLLADQALLQTIVTYHALAATVMSTDLQPEQTVDTIQGEPLAITVADGTVTVGPVAQVIEADIEADNGVVHKIDAVLIPPSVAASLGLG